MVSERVKPSITAGRTFAPTAQKAPLTGEALRYWDDIVALIMLWVRKGYITDEQGKAYIKYVTDDVQQYGLSTDTPFYENVMAHRKAGEQKKELRRKQEIQEAAFESTRYGKPEISAEEIRKHFEQLRQRQIIKPSASEVTAINRAREVGEKYGMPYTEALNVALRFAENTKGEEFTTLTPEQKGDLAQVALAQGVYGAKAFELGQIASEARIGWEGVVSPEAQRFAGEYNISPIKASGMATRYAQHPESAEFANLPAAQAKALSALSLSESGAGFDPYSNFQWSMAYHTGKIRYFGWEDFKEWQRQGEPQIRDYAKQFLPVEPTPYKELGVTGAPAWRDWFEREYPSIAREFMEKPREERLAPSWAQFLKERTARAREEWWVRGPYARGERPGAFQPPIKTVAF